MDYKMDHEKRGEAIIFNHQDFISPHYTSRSGTDVDCCRISYILEDIGFDVNIHNNYRRNDIIATMEAVAKKDHSKNDCLLVVIMSHGEKGKIAASDFTYKPQNLFDCFTDDKCPSLIGKPKIFFIQACRGEKSDIGCTLRTMTDSSDMESDLMGYTNPDFLIVYSTISGYYSWRCTKEGSWFIQELCNELEKDVFNIHILKLLTNVNRNVAINYESYVPEEEKKHRKKQIPCISSSLTRILLFTPKR